LQESLAKIHLEIADLQERRRITSKMAKKGVQFANFTIGDMVLWAKVDQVLKGNKLRVNWLGPYRVVKCNE
jgi:hypothetical protein